MTKTTTQREDDEKRQTAAARQTKMAGDERQKRAGRLYHIMMLFNIVMNIQWEISLTSSILEAIIIPDSAKIMI